MIQMLQQKWKLCPCDTLGQAVASQLQLQPTHPRTGLLASRLSLDDHGGGNRPVCMLAGCDLVFSLSITACIHAVSGRYALEVRNVLSRRRRGRDGREGFENCTMTDSYAWSESQAPAEQVDQQTVAEQPFFSRPEPACLPNAGTYC